MKNNDFVLLDLFSGTGGFHNGLSKAGFVFDKVYFSEIDKHAIANYKYNYPHAKYIGSVEHVLQSGIIQPTIITFGSPCQDFSLAGKRAGLEGAKSSLIQKAIAAISHFRPNVFIWENVKGAFSSNAGSDFWAIIQAFANIGGYRLEWQLVNTAWLLPQNRERIYLVGHLATAFPNWTSVFPIRETDFLHNQRELQESDQNTQTIAKTLNANDCKSWVGNFVQTEKINVVPKINIAAKLSNSQDGIVVHDNGLCPTISAGHGNTPKVVINPPLEHLVIGSMQKNAAIRTDGICTTLTGAMGMGGGQIPMVKQLNLLNQNPATPSIQPQQQNRVYGTNGLSPTLLAKTTSPIVKAVLTPNRKEKRQNGRRMKENGEPSFTLTAQDQHGVFDGTNIRRLTEIECERLQGFPDNWTQLGDYDGVVKPIPKTQRYKLLGNAVTAKMVQLIASRIKNNIT